MYIPQIVRILVQINLRYAMWLIIALIIVGVLLLVAELVLLPGLSVAGIGALICYGIAIYFGFSTYGTTGGLITIGGVLAVSIAATAISLRAKTWKRLALTNEIDGKSQVHPEDTVSIGDKGITITRLAPMGKVDVGGETFEAKSLGNKYLDPKTEVEVVGFENFNIIVKSL